MFGYSDLVVDPRNLVLMRDAGCPVTVDITHALQQPAGRALEVDRLSLLHTNALIASCDRIWSSLAMCLSRGTSIHWLCYLIGMPMQHSLEMI